MVPYELALKVGNSQYLYLIHRLLRAYHADYSYYNTFDPISQQGVFILHAKTPEV